MESISFGQCIRHAWHSTWLTVTRMPVLLLAVVAVYTALNLAPLVLLPAGDQTTSQPMRALMMIVLLPVSIAVYGTLFVKVHRFVLLDEPAQPVWPERGKPVRRYVQFMLAIGVASATIAVVLMCLYQISPSGAYGLGGLLVYPTFIYFLVRLSLLLPAIALGSRLDWKAAWHDSRGHFWSIFGVTLCAYLPLVAVIAAAASLLPMFVNDDPWSVPQLAAFAAVQAVFTVLWLVLAASTLSWLYRRHGQELPRAVSASHSDTPQR